MHHTMSGAWPSFHVMLSAITLAADEGSERSDEIYWKRWMDGEAAEAWERLAKLGRRGELVL